MTDESRNEMVRLQMERAERFLAQADLMLESKLFDLAANRYYYACFHAIQGLFIHDRLSSHTHRELHQTLGMNYVKEGKFDPQLSGFLRTMEQLREKADYNCAYDVTEDEVAEMRQPSHDIIETVKQMIAQ